MGNNLGDLDYNNIMRAHFGPIADIVSASGRLIPVNARPGSLDRVGDSEIVQVVLSPIYTGKPIFAVKYDPKLVGMWVARISATGVVEDGILLPDGTLWEDRDAKGIQRFSQYYLRGIRQFQDTYWKEQGWPGPPKVTGWPE